MKIGKRKIYIPLNSGEVMARKSNMEVDEEFLLACSVRDNKPSDIEDSVDEFEHVPFPASEKRRLEELIRRGFLGVYAIEVDKIFEKEGCTYTFDNENVDFTSYALGAGPKERNKTIQKLDVEKAYNLIVKAEPLLNDSKRKRNEIRALLKKIWLYDEWSPKNISETHDSEVIKIFREKVSRVRAGLKYNPPNKDN